MSAPGCFACIAADDVNRVVPREALASASAVFGFSFACCYGLAATHEAMCERHRRIFDAMMRSPAAVAPEPTPAPKTYLDLAHGREPTPEGMFSAARIVEGASK